MSVKRGIGFQRAVIFILRITLGWILALCLGFKYKKRKPKSTTYLVLANHNSDLDPVMVIMGTGRHARFVASANLLKGFLGRVLKVFFAPIPRNKGAAADDTVDLIEKNLKEGISVAMFPEGNKSWSGETGYISPRTAKLVKESGAGLVTYRLDGDYMKSPRWARHPRKGPVFGTFVRELTPEELKDMSEQKVYEIICKDLQTDAYAFQREKRIKYKGKDLAEGLELAAYLCPCCKKFDSVKTKGDTVFCDCGMKATLDEEGFFHSDTLPFSDLLTWSRWEKSYLFEHTTDYAGAVTTDTGLAFSLNGKRISNDATATFFSDRIEIDADKKYIFPLETIKKMGAFRTTRVFFTCKDAAYVELFKESGVSGIKYFTLWRVFSGKTLF